MVNNYHLLNRKSGILLELKGYIRKKYLRDVLLDNLIGDLLGKIDFLIDFFMIVLEKIKCLLPKKMFVKFLNRNIKNFLRNCLFCWSDLLDKKFLKKIYPTFFDIFVSFGIFEQPLIIVGGAIKRILKYFELVSKKFIRFFSVSKFNFEIYIRNFCSSSIIFKFVEVE